MFFCAESSRAWTNIFSPRPEVSKTLASGVLVRDWSGNQIFITERRWTKSPSQINMDKVYGENYGPADRGVSGRKYLLYSPDETKPDGKLVSSSVEIVELNSTEAKDIIIKLASKSDFVGEINPSWQFCESDNECMQTKNQCGELIGISKNYEKDYLGFLKSKVRLIDCSKIKSNKNDMNGMKCIDHFCSEPEIKVLTIFGFKY